MKKRDINVLLEARGEISMTSKTVAPKKGKGAKYKRANSKREARKALSSY
jgi:hypothetical protein